MTRRRARPNAGKPVLGPFSRADRWWIASNVGTVALVGISYFSAGRISDGVLGLPGGAVYGVLVLACVIAAVCGAARRPGTRVALPAITVGLAGYSAFCLVGGMLPDVERGLSSAHSTVGSVLLLNLVVGVLMVSMLRSMGRRTSTAPRTSTVPRTSTAPQDPGGDLFLPDEPDGRSGGVASRDALLDRLQTLAKEGDQETIPLVFVRLGGLHDIRRLHWSPVADRISATMTHRLRAQLRADDTVASLMPGEVFILLSGEASEASATAVVRRLEDTLARPITSVEGWQAKRLKVTVQLARATFTSSRLRVVADDEDLVDAPVAPARTETDAVITPVITLV